MADSLLVEDQALPITATICAVVAAFAAVWALLDGFALGPFDELPTSGWLLDETSRATYSLPGVLAGPMCLSALWTGFATTALTRVGETTALTKVDAVTGQTITATEPLWAAAFGVLLCGETMDSSALIGGSLVVLACLVSAAEPERLRQLWRQLASPILPGSVKPGSVKPGSTQPLGSSNRSSDRALERDE
uniref:EamA domain-containing protein n=1 Tax=Haptolina ericina TaxID=156174 RepID=A0A7S3EU27_9EUKA